MDECALGSDCDDHASCQNTEGSYICTCIQPYSGDGKNCTGSRLQHRNPVNSSAPSIPEPMCVLLLPEPVKCENPGSLDFGRRVGSNFLNGGEVVFGCENGYELVGSSRLHCLETGNWDNPVPYCRGKGVSGMSYSAAATLY